MFVVWMISVLLEMENVTSGRWREGSSAMGVSIRIMSGRDEDRSD